METLVKTKEMPVNYRPALSLKTIDLSAGIKSTIDNIDSCVKSNNLIIVGNEGKVSSEDILNSYESFQFENFIMAMTKSGKKRLAKKIRNTNYKMTLRSMNSFLNFIRKKVVTNEELMPMKISVSHNDHKISKIREKYKLLKTEFRKVRSEYQSEKKTYFQAGNKYFGS